MSRGFRLARREMFVLAHPPHSFQGNIYIREMNKSLSNRYK
jgi:hypothetical protein